LVDWRRTAILCNKILADSPQQPVGAVTVHSAQRVTTDNAHPVIADTATRAMAYVALTRGRDTNQAYIYTRDNAEAHHDHSAAPDVGALHQLCCSRNRAATASLTPIGTGTARAASTVTYRLHAPGCGNTLTRSPMANPVTPGPSAATVPVASSPTPRRATPVG
jgi:hypothetical protein